MSPVRLVPTLRVTLMSSYSGQRNLIETKALRSFETSAILNPKSQHNISEDWNIVNNTFLSLSLSLDLIYTIVYDVSLSENCAVLGSFMLRIRENPNSDFGPDTGYTLSRFCLSSPVLLGIY